MAHFFYFQAEDGIRDDLVTGVQTCALPISSPSSTSFAKSTASADITMPMLLRSSGPQPQTLSSKKSPDFVTVSLGQNTRARTHKCIGGRVQPDVRNRLLCGQRASGDRYRGLIQS